MEKLQSAMLRDFSMLVCDYYGGEMITIIKLVATLLFLFSIHAFSQEEFDTCRSTEINLHLEKVKIGKFWTNGHLEYDEPKLNFFKIKIGTGFVGQFGQYSSSQRGSLQGGHIKIANGRIIVNGLISNDPVDNYGGQFFTHVETIIITDIKNNSEWEIKPSMQNHFSKNNLGYIQYDDFAIAPLAPGFFFVSKTSGDEIGIHIGPNFVMNSGFQLQNIGAELMITIHSDLCPLSSAAPRSFDDIADENLAE